MSQRSLSCFFRVGCAIAFVLGLFSSSLSWACLGRSGVRFVTSLGRLGSASSRISSQPGAPAANWRSQEWILQERTRRRRRQQQQQLCLGRVPVLQAWDSLLWTVAWSKQASLQASRPYEEDGGDSAQQATACVCVWREAPAHTRALAPERRQQPPPVRRQAPCRERGRRSHANCNQVQLGSGLCGAV